MVTLFPTAVIARSTLFQPYWSGFRLDNIMRPLVVFSVSRSSLAETSSLAPIIYDTVSINEGLAWSTANNTFVVPLNGIYFFSWSCGVIKDNYTGLILRVNRQNTYAAFTSIVAIIPDYKSHDFVSRSALLSLNHYDVIDIAFIHATIYSDFYHMQISLQGFYYCPSSGIQVGCKSI